MTDRVTENIQCTVMLEGQFLTLVVRFSAFALVDCFTR